LQKNALKHPLAEPIKGRKYALETLSKAALIK